MKRGKKKDLLTPTTFSLLHAVDFADRLTYKIIPPLKPAWWCSPTATSIPPSAATWPRDPS